jgi:prenylcysteine oxidase/farnesylcysteine lyase
MGINGNSGASSGPLKLAIIGTGIAGSAAAYFARREIRPGVAITVFERDSRVGGRMEHRPFAGTVIETGGTLLHSSNEYAAEMMNDLGLSRTLPQDRDGSGASTVGIWNGKTVTFQTSRYGAITAAKMIGRYGLSPIRTGKAVKAEVKKWTRIYELQRGGRAYSTVEAMFSALGLAELCREPSLDFFRRSEIGHAFVSEFVDGISRNNYGQGNSLQAFANVVSLAGAGFAGGGLYSIQGGNALLAELLLEYAKVRLRPNTTVHKIKGPEEGSDGYRVIVDGDPELLFDALIIATPLEVAAIELDVPGIQGSVIMDRPFQITHATFVAGELNPAFFGRARASTLPATMLTVEDPDIWISSVGRVGFSPAKGVPVYKVFSRETLSDREIDQVFSSRLEVERIVWRAYPVLGPSTAWPSFELARGLYYPNAMESAVSTIETEAVAARNVVALLKNMATAKAQK